MSGCLDHNLCLQYFHLFSFVSAALTLTSQIKNFPVTLLLLPLKRSDTNAYSRSRLCTPTLVIYLRCHTHYQLLPGIIIFPRSWPMFPGPPLANLTQPSQQQHSPFLSTSTNSASNNSFLLVWMSEDTGRMERYGTDEPERKPQGCSLEAPQHWATLGKHGPIQRASAGKRGAGCRERSRSASLDLPLAQCTYHALTASAL